MRKRCVALYVVTVIFLALLTACSGGSGVRIASPGANNVVNPGAPITLNGSGATDLSFAISSSTCATSGTLSNQTGTSAVYTPPTSNTADCTETITATSAAQPSRHGSITLTVKAITVSLNSSAGSTTLPAGAPPVTLTATLHNEAAGSTDVVNWSIQAHDITPASRSGRATPNVELTSSCGTLSSDSGTQVTYTPPATLTSACAALITASSSFNGNHASVTFTITAPADHLSVTPSLSTVSAGTQIAVAVRALDAANNLVTGYTGTVHFTSTDAAAVLPANYTFLPGDNGARTFNVTLKTAGTQTITATDTVTGTITGSTGNITVNPAAASHFTVTGTPASVAAGTQVGFTVTALDAFNNTVNGYSGTVHFTSTDAQATLPANSTLTNGTGDFQATLKTSGSQTITATDTVNGSVNGTSGSVSVSAGPVTQLAVSAPASATPNVAFNFNVTAEDQFNNKVTTFAEQVHFTSSDGSAALPANSTLTNGEGTFSATLVTLGDQTLSANDAVVGSEWIAGTAHINVTSNPATHFSVTAPATATAGVQFSFTVQALDASNNPTSGYSGTVHFTSTDSFATLPANATLTNGAGTFNATLVSGGTQTITATDTVTSSITGASGNIGVGAAAATHLLITAPGTATTGSSFNFTVTAQDQFNNTAAGYSGTVHFTSTDGSATLPANATLTNGTGSFSATLQTTGTQTIAATDTVTNTITGTSGDITVNATSNTFTLNPNDKNFAVAGQPFAVQLNAQGGTQPYTDLSVTNGTLPAGMSLSLPSLAVVGTPTTPGTYQFTAQLTDNANHIATADITVKVATAPNHQHDSWLNGRYSCLARGFVDNDGSPYAYATVSSFPLTGGSTFANGVFNLVMDGGTSMAGQTISETTQGSGQPTGTVNLGSDNNGLFTITIPNDGRVPSTVGTYTYAITANQIASGPATEFHGVEIDDIGTSPSGRHGEISCYRDTTSAFTSSTINGNSFAFALEGSDNGNGSNIVGVLKLSSGSIDSNVSESDEFGADGTAKHTNSASNHPLAGTYVSPNSTTGRFQITLNPGDTQRAEDVFVYLIDSTRAVVLAAADPVNTQGGGFQAGNFHKQLNGPYSSATLNNSTFVVYYRSTRYNSGVVDKYSSTLLQGLGNSTGFNVNAIYQDAVPVDNGQTGQSVLSLQQAGSVVMSIASNGRASFVPEGETNAIYFYFYDTASAFMMDTAEGLGTGVVEKQASRATPGGDYILFDLPSQIANGRDSAGLFTLDSGTRTIPSASIDTAGEELFRWAAPLDSPSTPTYTVPDGNGYVLLSAGDDVDCFTITASKFACVSKDDQPTIHVLTK